MIVDEDQKSDLQERKLENDSLSTVSEALKETINLLETRISFKTALLGPTQR